MCWAGCRTKYNKRMLSDWFSAALQTSRKCGRLGYLLMKYLSLLCLSFLLSSCVGLAVGTFGTLENKVENPRITPEKNERKNFPRKSEPKLTEQKLLDLWGVSQIIDRNMGAARC